LLALHLAATWVFAPGGSMVQQSAKEGFERKLYWDPALRISALVFKSGNQRPRGPKVAKRLPKTVFLASLSYDSVHLVACSKTLIIN
jgi:hypothetical protein